MIKDKKYMKPKEAAEYMGVARSTIYNWEKKGLIKMHRIEGISRIKKADLDKLFKDS